MTASPRAQVYQLGCVVAAPALAPAELCRDNCDFERMDAWRPMIPGPSAVGAPLLCTSENDAKLAQKLGQLQPFIAVLPQEYVGQLASAGPT
jgi:hypothetical protein